MAIIVNTTAVDYIETLIEANKINTEGNWSFSADDGNSLLGENMDWENYAKYHLAIDTEAERETKARFMFPVGKGDEVYRRGLIAAKQRAAQNDYSNIADAADKLLVMVDSGEKASVLKSIFDQIMALVLPNHKKEVDLSLPSYMVDNLKRGLMLYEEGKGGDGLVASTIREARQMVRTGKITPDKIVRMSAWLARHASDKTANWDKRGEETPGFVAHLLWASNGDGRAKGWVDRKKDELAERGVKSLVVKQGRNFMVIKEIDGSGRWFGWVTNKFEDREAEILTDAAHAEFYNFLNDYPEMAPELWVWHTPGTARKNKADWWEYANGFFMYSGKLTEDEMLAYEDDDPETEIGMSHGFWVLDRQGKFINKYRTFEVSELPLRYAANPYTGFHVKEEAKNMFSESKRQFLAARLGADRVAQLEAGTEEMEKALLESGTNWKELNEQYEAEQQKQIADMVAEQTKARVAEVVEQVVEALNVKGLQEILTQMHTDIEANKGLIDEIAALKEQVTHLMETEDERVAKTFEAAEPLNWGFLASKSDENVIPETEVPTEVVEQVKQVSGEMDWLKGLVPGGK